MGKSSALVHWSLNVVNSGEGEGAFFNPYGVAIDDILLHIPPERRKDVVRYDVSDCEYPIGFNIFHNVPPKRSEVVPHCWTVWQLS